MSSRIVTESIIGNLMQGGSVATCFTDADTDIVQRGDAVRLTDETGEYIYLSGHVLDDPRISFDGLTSRATFRVGTANNLADGRLQAIGFTEQATPANSHQIAPTMTFGDMVDHILRDHSNMIFDATTMPDGAITDVDIDFTDVAINRYNLYQSNDFWTVIQNRLAGGETGGIQFYRPYFTKENGFRYKPAPHYRDSSITSKGTLDKTTILGRVSVEQNFRRFAQAQVGALANGGVLYSAEHPTSPLDGEIFEITQGVFADSQSRTDDFAEGLYKWLSRKYTVRVEVHPLLLLHEGLDIADKVVIDYDGPAEDAITGNGVHIDFDNQEFIVYGYEVQNNPSQQSGRAFLDLESVN